MTMELVQSQGTVCAACFLTAAAMRMPSTTICWGPDSIDFYVMPESLPIILAGDVKWKWMKYLKHKCWHSQI